METASILEGWTVQNMMRRDVVTVPSTMSVTALARVFDDENISGAPVVDLQGQVVGVVSQSDIVREISRQVDSTTSSSESTAVSRHAGRENGGGEVLISSFFLRTNRQPHLEAVTIPPSDPIGEKSVAAIMMPARFSVRPSTSLAGLARYLVNAKVHRALVMEDGALLGIVTTFDVLHAIANSEVHDPAGGAGLSS